MKATKLSQVVIESNGNLAEAGRKLGVSRQAVSKALDTPLVQSVMTQALEKAGISDSMLAKKIKEGLNAKKPVMVETDDIMENGQVRKVEVEIDDHPTRHKFVVTALQVKGHIKTTGDVNTQVNVDNSKTQVFTGLAADVEDKGFADAIRTINDRLSKQFK